MKKLVLHSLLIASAATTSAQAANFSMFAEGLLWNASEQTTTIWNSTITTNSVVDPTEVAFSPTNLNFNWSPGVRGGLQYETDNHKWLSKVTWTYFPSLAKTGKRLSAQLITSEFFSGFLSKNYFFGADIDWHLKLNTIDFDVSHPIQVSKRFTISPTIGIKTAFINQSIDSSWDALTYVAKEYVDHDFRGIGPSFGLNANYALPNNVSVFGDIMSSFMWGNWNIKDQYVRPNAVGVTAVTITTSMNESKLGTLMLDTQLGLKWTHKGRSEVSVKLAYEMQYWANQVRIPTFQILPVRGDLTIQGATCGIYIDL